jgi:hypothetical protein
MPLVTCGDPDNMAGFEVDDEATGTESGCVTAESMDEEGATRIWPFRLEVEIDVGKRLDIAEGEIALVSSAYCREGPAEVEPRIG